MKPFVYIASIAFVFLLLGCGTIKETTITTTEPIKIPAVVIHDTISTYIPYEVFIQNGIDIDSAQRAYFIKNCNGTMEIDKDGLKATISFLSRDNRGKAQTITQLTAEVEKKQQEILQTKKTVSTESTPGDWWIFWASMKFWLSAIFLGILIGIVGTIILRMKTQLLKFIP
jgi:hypothetical protein